MEKDTATKTSWEKIWHAIPLTLKDWAASILIGILTVSHWRSLWTLFDIWLCDQPADASLVDGTNFCLTVPAMENEAIRQERFDSAISTYLIGVGCTIFGVFLMWGGMWFPDNGKVSCARGVIRFIIMYILGMAACTMWRGIWYLTDHWILPNDPTASNWLTSFVGAAGAFLLFAGGSLLAPPAIFLLDGPSVDPPPVAITLVSTYFDLTLPADENKPPSIPKIALAADALISFFGLPIFVVWFWRGTWYLLDDFFWGLTTSETDVQLSVLWSVIFAVFCTVLTCEPLMSYIESLAVHEKLGRQIVGRLRTFIMAWGTVSFWRAVWTFWDLWLGRTSKGSAYGGEIASIFGLTLIGCLSCIVAPPATLGLDIVPHPESADEPLFAMLPLPWDLLYIGAIGRHPPPEPHAHLPLSADEVEAESKRDQEVELSRMDLPEEPLDTIVEGEEPESSSLRFRAAANIAARLNAGVTEVRLGNRSYCEMQRSHLLQREKSVRCLKQRPGLDNYRKRSQYFRNR